MKAKKLTLVLMLLITAVIQQPQKIFAQEALPVYLRDRGTGIPVSMFGTYVRKGELLIYPFYEYIYDHNMEYEPFDFGFESKREFRGHFRAHEGLIFIGYGISDRLALEFEAGVITADLDKSDNDLSALPATLEESGLSDVEGQIRWRWNYETAKTPEVYNFFEYVLPIGEKKSLIGTSDWELKLGTGLIKGFNWGTVTFRVSVDYTAAEKKLEPGEYALEYLKRVSNRIRFFVMLEGSEDEIELIPEIQWHINRNIFFKGNSGFGVTSKAADVAPEVGIMFLL
ncbi:hypothetical protein GWN28_04795 [candidate division KSB1 bacterium]|nr:hypothetical protein [Phycisphaerae bacterium]NIU10476.1 hypothetical protein [Phycisphaerae bacterium]NIW17712.1 hypothetical protein [candidate division KSB1 bacterium]NIX30108.1 hypothetical protein [Phycisphaerae bacterium]